MRTIKANSSETASIASIMSQTKKHSLDMIYKMNQNSNNHIGLENIDIMKNARKTNPVIV